MFTQTTARFMTTIRFSLFGLVALALPMSLIACSESNSLEDLPTPSPNSTVTPVPEEVQDPEEAAIAAYTRYRLAHVAAAALPDPDYAELTESAAGTALESTRDAVQRLVDNGWRAEGEPTFDVVVKEAALERDPVQVVVTDCSDSSGWAILDADTGEPVPDEEYGRRSIDALVELREGRWVVTEIGARSIGSCLPVAVGECWYWLGSYSSV